MRFLSFLLVLLAFSTPALAQNAPAKHSQAVLRSPLTALSGDNAPAALEITMEDGWKTYWRTPGEAGLAPVFDWAGSSNLRDVKVSYPAPHRFVTFDIDNYGYKHKVVFPLEIALQEKDKAVEAKLKLDLLVCSDICVPETHEISLSLPAGASSSSEFKEEYEAALKTLPRTTDESFSFQTASLSVDSDNTLYMNVTAKTPRAASNDADLFIEHRSASLTFGKPEIVFDADAGILRFKAPVNTVESADKVAKTISSAPLTLTYADGETAIEGTLAVESAAGKAEVAPPVAAQAPGLDLRLILFALLGGLILNLMPCVLPVLSLKVLSVMSHGGSENRKAIFSSFMASALGILASFWLMAGVLSAIKAAGGTIGWGIQFQHPAFLLFLIAVVTLFSLNLWGLFEIPLPRFIAAKLGGRREEEPTLLGNFLTGAFATLLATPCTAPFLGTAIGFALAGSAGDIFVIFTFLGLGLALPYILLALSPRLFKYMPKPGKWMVKLRRVMSVALLLTAAWLINVLLTVTTQATLDSGWTKFDAALIAPAVAEGRTVVVDVTADWCLTCKANKRLVLNQDDVIAAMSGENILKLQADWTMRDEAIAAYLKKYGRYGIPFNIVYGPAAPEGIVLPELLSKKAVTDALITAAGE